MLWRPRSGLSSRKNEWCLPRMVRPSCASPAQPTPPLVLLPGACSTSLMWAPNIKALSEACRTFAVDQIGDSGRTICTKPVRHLNDLLFWLDELFDALKLGDR